MVFIHDKIPIINWNASEIPFELTDTCVIFAADVLCSQWNVKFIKKEYQDKTNAHVQNQTGDRFLFIICFAMSNFHGRTKLTQDIKRLICDNFKPIKYLVSSIFNILFQRSTFDCVIINASSVWLQMTRELYGSFSISTLNRVQDIECLR